MGKFGSWCLLVLVPYSLFASSSPTALAFSPSVAIPRCSSSVISRLDASASAEVVTSSPLQSQQRKDNSFVSPKFNVYIEDTDAYGVMYNGNYLRSYERALSHVPREHDGRWILSSISNQKFRSSPALGEEYLIRGELIEPSKDDNDDDSMREDGVEEWRLEMVTKNSKTINPDDDESEDDWIVHNSATATLSSTKKEDASGSAALALVSSTTQPSDTANLGKMYEYSFTPYHDEFDMHLHQDGHSHKSHHIPLRSAMNFFERSRTIALGGPDALRRLQVDDDILFVVTGVDDGELFLDSITFEHPIDENDVSLEDGTHEWHPLPGKEITVQTNFVMKRRGMLLECQQRLFMDVVAADGQIIFKNRRLLSQATVTIMALKGSTRRPTSKLPQWVLDIF